MDVFVIPVGSDRYELYCEAPVEVPPVAAGSNGIIERIKFRFAVQAHEAEELRRSGASARAETRLGRLKQSFMAWFAERREEHRLLSNLRHERAVVAFHPQDLTFEQTHTLIRRTLQREWERHRLWLVIDSVL